MPTPEDVLREAIDGWWAKPDAAAMIAALNRAGYAVVSVVRVQDDSVQIMTAAVKELGGQNGDTEIVGSLTTEEVMARAVDALARAGFKIVPAVRPTWPADVKPIL